MDLYPPIDELQNEVTDDTVYFFTDAVNTLNNWSAHAVDIWGKRFPTVEHAFHYKKFEDTAPEIAAQILSAGSPYQAMKLAKTHKSKRRTDWDEVKADFMTDITRQKVAQHPDVREALLATGNRKLVENSPWDTFWGCGADGTGRNMMGGILEKVRAELKASDRWPYLLQYASSAHWLRVEGLFSD